MRCHQCFGWWVQEGEAAAGAGLLKIRSKLEFDSLVASGACGGVHAAAPHQALPSAKCPHRCRTPTTHAPPAPPGRPAPTQARS